MTPRAAAVLPVASLLLAGCTTAPEPGPGADRGTLRPSESGVVAPGTDAGRAVTDPLLDLAVNEPVEDRVYPEVGDPGVDALHYQLDLAWTPETETLDAVETLVFRATEDAEQFQLDFGRALSVSTLEVDGVEVDHVEDGKDLLVEHPVTADERYRVRIHYTGTPRPVPAPTTRTDFDTVGWHTTDTGETWTMQEPFGAYSWYAVNDHPSDKALYDFTISTPAPWVGVANGVLASREVVDGNTVTEWHLDEPAASYVVTAAIGSFRFRRDRSDSGVPMTYWTPRGDVAAARAVRAAGRELDWVEDRLGPYPFSSLGVVVVDSQSGMETQTMITLGDTDYTLSPEVMVHEIVHQWWGNQVAPRDWRDVWMNEGMATYLQALWESEHHDVPLDSVLAEWAALDQQARDEAGPPADYDPVAFGEGNIYYLPALMWHQLRREIGTRRFWRLARAWPRENDNGHGSYEEITDWWSERTGRDLTAYFDSWLLSEQSPRFDG